MNQRLPRAVVGAGLCASLSGCGGTLGKGGAGLLAAGLLRVVATAIAAAASDDDHTQAPAPVVIARMASYPDDEDPAMLTCDAKRREFRAAHDGIRKLPPQLLCSSDGAFGSPQVYGTSAGDMLASGDGDGESL